MKQLCWCGNPNVEEFSPEYLRCDVCSTLISKSFPANDITTIRDEAADFYGKKYWLDHQVEELGLGSIEQRSRTDLVDRCGLWLDRLLEFSLPPAQLLEIGCSHGGFLALAKLAGFLVTGIELSPWVVEFARKSFDVNVLIGPIERLNFKAGSFDVICMFDVLEHLQDPVRTLRACVQALTLEGIFLVQTPQYPGRVDFAKLCEQQHPFLEMMLPDEHLFLFSEESVRNLLKEAGFVGCEFVPAPFAHYDMMFAAGKRQLERKSKSAKQVALGNSAGGRVMEGLLTFLQENDSREAQRQDLLANFVQAKQDIETLQVRIKRLSQEMHYLAEERRDLAERRDCLVEENRHLAEKQDRLGEEMHHLTAEHNQLTEEQHKLAEERHRFEEWLRRAYAERNRLRKSAGLEAAFKQWAKSLFSSVAKRIPTWIPRSRRRRTRVCVDLTGIPATGGDGGLTMAVIDLLKHLCRDERFDFIYLSVERSYAAASSFLRPRDSLILISAGSHKTRYGNAQPVWRTLTAENLKRHRIDIFYRPSCVIPIAARGFKTVCLVPDLLHRDCPELIPPERPDDRELVISNSLDEARKVQVPSVYIRRRLLETYPVSPEQIFVTYFRVENRAQDIPLINPRNRPFFFCPDGYFSGRSIKAMLTGYKQYLRSTGQNGWALVFAGHSDDSLSQLRELADSLELGGDVEIEPELRTENALNLLRAAGALLYPVLHEGPGIPVFEAFQYSVPVICSSASSLPELAGEAAFYVDPNSPKEIARAMYEVSSSSETRARLVDLGLKRIKNISPADEAEKLGTVFAELAEGK
jgi:glycosyltransferase involved in cell wall biosynthesis/2-polyprenyl-3-methyl-5-hydroxy-6-metoxy-1,4-benzoquinol methylase